MHTLKKFIHYYGPYKAVFFSGSDLCYDHQSNRSGISSDPAYLYQLPCLRKAVPLF